MLTDKLKEYITSATKPITSIEIVCSEKGFLDFVRNLDLWHETDKDNFFTVFMEKGISFTKVRKKTYSKITFHLKDSSKPVNLIVED